MMIKSTSSWVWKEGGRSIFEFEIVWLSSELLGLPRFGVFRERERERECHVAKWEVSYTRLSSIQDGSKTKGSETQPWSLKSGLPSDSFMEKCGVWCTFIGWSTYTGHDVNVVEILMHKKTRKRKGHRWFHKRRERNCPQPQTDKISQRGEQPAQGHSPTVGKNQIHSPFTNAKSCLLSFQLSLLFP